MQDPNPPPSGDPSSTANPTAPEPVLEPAEENLAPDAVVPIPPEVLEPPPAPEAVPVLVADEGTEPNTAAPSESESVEGEPDIDFRKLDPDALKVVRRLRQKGHETYFVGGCVRDLLVGRKPKDFDIATSAHPNEVRGTFRNCRLIGRRFRLAHVYFREGKIVEVSTFRANPSEVEEVPAVVEALPAEGEAEAMDAGGPAAEPVAEEDLLISDDNVFGTAEQDARRRDFTINGLFYDIGSGKVVDYVRGRRDLALRYIRTIGDPEVRMREDPVRILRAVRFASRLNFDIESRTYAAMEGAVEDLPRCAPPRLLEDTFRLIRGGVAAPGLKLLAALDALKHLLPPLDAYLKGRGVEGEKTFYAFAESLDRRVNSGEKLEDAVLLAALLVPVAREQSEELEGEERPHVAKVIEDLLQEFVRTARLPRRIAERCRIILIAQRTLTGERRRRGSLASFRRHPLYNESLVVFEISVEATGEHREALEAWQRGSVPTSTPGAPGPAATPGSTSGPGGTAGASETTGKRRRRRRRRGGAGREGDAVGSSPAEASQPNASQDSGDAGESIPEVSDAEG